MRMKLMTELKLNRRQRLYVEGVRAGKSRRQAALDAGYSLSSANNVAFNIERRGRGGNPIMRYFWDLLKPPQKARNSASVGNGSEARRQFPPQVQPDQ
jgi:hypothetical protein